MDGFEQIDGEIDGDGLYTHCFFIQMLFSV